MLALALLLVAVDPNCDPALPKRAVDVRVSPWADVIVDGHVVAKGVMRAHVELAPGPHSVQFRNPLARDVDRVVVVPAEGPVPDVAAVLEKKPDVVVVHGARARVDVDVRSRREVQQRRVDLKPGDSSAFEVRLDSRSP
jgi:hypothetical protein